MPPPDFAVLPYRRPLLPDARFPFPPKVPAGIRIWIYPESPPSCPEVPVQYPTAGLRQNAGDLVPVPFSFFSWLLLLSCFCYFSNTTNGRTDSPAGIFLLCCVPLSSGRQYLPDRQIIEGMGNRNPKQEPYTGKHDSVLRGGSCPIISTPSLNVTGSGYYTTAKRNNFILINQIRSYLFYSLKIPSLNPIVRDRNTRGFEKSFNFLLQKRFPLTYRKEIRELYSVWRQSFNKVHKKTSRLF